MNRIFIQYAALAWLMAVASLFPAPARAAAADYIKVDFDVPLFLAAAVTADNSERGTLVECGPFVKIYDQGAGEKQAWYINDHCFIQGTDDVWHVFGITHPEPADPEHEIYFAHATARTLLQQPWEKQPFALTAATGAPWHETHLWAPDIVLFNGLYYMFYCAGGGHAEYKINLATSPDLQTWTRSPKNPMVVDGFDARDPFLLRVNGQWVMYYCATSKPEGGNHVVACQTATCSPGPIEALLLPTRQSERAGGTPNRRTSCNGPIHSTCSLDRVAATTAPTFS